MKRGTRYLCAASFYECAGKGLRTRLCLLNHLYDPNRHECITNLCPLQSTSTGQYVITSGEGGSSTGDGSESSSSSSSSSSHTSSSGIVTEGGESSSSSGVSSGTSTSVQSGSGSTSISETTIEHKDCFTSYSQCKNYNFCTNTNERGTRYLCAASSGSVTEGGESSSSSGVSSGTSTSVQSGSGSTSISEATIEHKDCFTSYSQCKNYNFCSNTNERGTRYLCAASFSECAVESGSGSTSITGTTIEHKDCFTSYSHCKNYNFCTNTNERGTRYLCAASFSECAGKSGRTRLCLLNHLYDPKRHECITNLCPLQSTSTGQYVITSEEVGSKSGRTRLCLLNHLYDPKSHECITNLCPLQSTSTGQYVITSGEGGSSTGDGSESSSSSSSSSSHTSSSGSVTEGEESSSISGASSGTSSSIESFKSGSGSTSISETTIEHKDCFTSYSQCKNGTISVQIQMKEELDICVQHRFLNVREGEVPVTDPESSSSSSHTSSSGSVTEGGESSSSSGVSSGTSSSLESGSGSTSIQERP
ncbi:hypothetical protein Avbf_12742 [Armadillidium vulgare]|nr:hypothetical protein Avbf_12742 [Armadillidium vulgare]